MARRRVATWLGAVVVVVLGVAAAVAVLTAPPMVSTIGGQINTEVDRSLIPADQIDGSSDTTCPSPDAAGECGP